ncbi:MAG: redoxin family protein [Thiohalorhabdus sp.]
MVGDGREGKRLPEVTFQSRRDNQWVRVASCEVFDSRTVVVFALPGAFTTTGSAAQMPRFNNLAPMFRENGVDDMVCVSVNDAFVMKARQADH